MTNKTLKICAGLFATGAFLKQSEAREFSNSQNDCLAKDNVGEDQLQINTNELFMVNMSTQELMYSFQRDNEQIMSFLQKNISELKDAKIVTQVDFPENFKKWKKSNPVDYYCRRPNPDKDARGCPLKRFSKQCKNECTGDKKSSVIISYSAKASMLINDFEFNINFNNVNTNANPIEDKQIINATLNFAKAVTVDYDLIEGKTRDEKRKNQANSIAKLFDRNAFLRPTVGVLIRWQYSNPTNIRAYFEDHFSSSNLKKLSVVNHDFNITKIADDLMTNIAFVKFNYIDNNGNEVFVTAEMTFTFKREGEEWKILQLISQPMKCNQNVPETLQEQGDAWTLWDNDC